MMRRVLIALCVLLLPAGVLADDERAANIRVQNAAILDIRILTHSDRIVIAAQNRVEPNRSILFENHIAEDGCILGHPIISGLRCLRPNPVKIVQSHMFSH